MNDNNVVPLYKRRLLFWTSLPLLSQKPVKTAQNTLSDTPVIHTV